MSGNEEEQRLWARRVLAWESATAKLREIEVQAAVRDTLGHATEAQALRATRQRLGDELVRALSDNDLAGGVATAEQLSRQAGTVVPAAVQASSAKGQYKALAKLVETVGDEIHLTDATGRTKDKLDARLADMRRRFAPLRDTSPKDQLDALEDSARDLLDDALKEGYLDEFRRDMVPDRRNGTYAEMIAERYGVNVNFGFDKKVDLGKLYDALSLLPREHVQTTSLTSIVMSLTEEGALGDYGNKRIRIDAISVRKRPKTEYMVDGSSKSLDTMSVVTLHEVGHAVDDKAKIMATPSAESYGGWVPNVTARMVADAYWTTLAPNVDPRFKDALLEEIEGALGGGPAKRPNGMPDHEWAAARATLVACQELAKAKAPWKTPRAVGDVVYHCDRGTWHGYSMKARNAVSVSDYQWRSPAEWFAELYAASWATKTKPAAAVNPKAAEYMFRGAA
jgi:hypothetical protein